MGESLAEPSFDDRRLVEAILHWMELKRRQLSQMRRWRKDGIVPDPRRFLGADFALEFQKLTLMLLVKLCPRLPTLDFEPVAAICHYVLAWNLAGPDERYVPSDGDLYWA